MSEKTKEEEKKIEEKKEEKKKKKKEEKPKTLDLSKTCKACDLLLYVDQIGHRKEKLTVDEQKIILNSFLEEDIDLDDIAFYGIVHDSDLKTLVDKEGYSEELEKPHIHLVFYCSSHQFRPIVLFKKLGIDITQADVNYLTHGGFEYLNIRKHEVCKSVLYLVHQTDKSILDRKFPYEVANIVTNDPDRDYFLHYSDEYNKYCHGLFISKTGQVKQLDEEDMLFDILDEVFKLGYDLGDFDSYLESLPRRYKYKYEKKIEEYYYKGVRRRYEDKANLDVHRVSIFIYGPPGCGKTYGSIHTLLDLDRKVYQVGQSSGTGGEDYIKPNDCLVYDDRIPKNALDKADTNICELYKRNSGNGIFGGDFFIINHNRCFYEAFKNYYKDKDDDSTELSEEAKALATRFYVLEVTLDGNVLVKGKCTRGLKADIDIRDKKFDSFLKIFQSYIKTKAESV